ncbi:MAG: hypothetical protein V4757_07275 [Pseudomonadota bacterium]
MTTAAPAQGLRALSLNLKQSALSDDTPQPCPNALIPQQCQRCGKCADESFAALGDEARREMEERGYGG